MVPRFTSEEVDGVQIHKDESFDQAFQRFLKTPYGMSANLLRDKLPQFDNKLENRIAVQQPVLQWNVQTPGVTPTETNVCYPAPTILNNFSRDHTLIEPRFFLRTPGYSQEAYSWLSSNPPIQYENKPLRFDGMSHGKRNTPYGFRPEEQLINNTHFVNPGKYTECIKDATAESKDDTHTYHHHSRISHEISNVKDGNCGKSKTGKMTSLGASPKCNVCSYKPNEARVVTFCGHLFCWPCLCCWLHNDSPNKNCPVCKCPLTRNNLTALHGRQNTMTVARLQGMLRTDKQSVRGSGHVRESKSKSLQQTRTRVSSDVTRKISRARMEVQFRKGANALSKDTIKNDHKVDIQHSRCQETSKKADHCSAAEVDKTGSLESHITREEVSSSSIDVPDIIVATSNTLFLEDLSATKESACEDVNLNSLHEKGSLIQQVVDMDSLLNIANDGMVDRIMGTPEEEMMETAYKLSVEWEDTMSVIEDFCWASMHILKNSHEIIIPRDDIDVENWRGSPEDNVNLTYLVESLLQEREDAIQQLAVQPLQAAEWLPGKLSRMQRLIRSSTHCEKERAGKADLWALSDSLFEEISVESSENSFPGDNYVCPFESENISLPSLPLGKRKSESIYIVGEVFEGRNLEDTSLAKRGKWR